MLSARVIAIGGAATAGTTVNITGTLAAAARTLVAFGQAAMTQSAVVQDGSAGGVVLADGASYTANDENTGILVSAVGTFTTSTFFDVIFHYTVQKQP